MWFNFPRTFPHKKVHLLFRPTTSASILLDQGYLTDAYPVLQFSKGKNASITLSYAEALYVSEPDKKDWRTLHQKGNRNQVEGKMFIGLKDSLISDGSDAQEFTSLWWRTYRYMQVQVQQEKSLLPSTISMEYLRVSLYMNAKFDAGNDTLNKILETGWRTARSCAMETYMDCPYYEQLQYVGDTRIQCLVSLYQ